MRTAQCPRALGKGGGLPAENKTKPQGEMIDEFIKGGLGTNTAFFKKMTTVYKDEQDRETHTWMAHKEKLKTKTVVLNDTVCVYVC